MRVYLGAMAEHPSRVEPGRVAAWAEGRQAGSGRQNTVPQLNPGAADPTLSVTHGTDSMM